MAKEYKVGEGYFLPVKITSTDYDREFPVQFSYFDGQVYYTECVQDGTLLTAEEIVKASNLPAVLIEEGLTARITELEAKNATLTAELEDEKANTYGWTNTAEERGRLISGLRESLNKASGENDELITKNNELEDANRSLTKACSEWQTAAQAHFKTTEKLREENKKLKQQLADANELLSDAQAKVKELTEADCMRLQEFKPIIEERDRLKAEVATRTDNVKNLVEENDRLKKLLNSKEESMRGVEEYADQLKKIADDLGDENEKLKAENDRLKTDSDEWEKSARMYSERLCSLKEEVDAVKSELGQERKRTQVWKDSSEEHRQRAEELEGDVKRYEEDIADNEVKIQRLEQENDSLKADILELKAQINAFRSSRSDPEEVEELKKRINMLEKLKEVHVKTMRRLTRQLKEKDFVISALVKKSIELEEGGESNG